MKVWLLIKTDGTDYRLFSKTPNVEQIVHHFHYGSKHAEELAQEVINGATRLGWYLVEEIVE